MTTSKNTSASHSLKEETPLTYPIEAPLSETGLSFAQIKDLMTHMKKEGVTSFKFGEGSTRIAIRREKEIVYMNGATEGVYANSMAFATEPVVTEPAALPDTGYAVTSPVVGVFYDSPAPDQDPYVGVGSFVKKGEVLCIVEAMKLMNEVTSPISGVVREVLVQKASRVEYGQKLFIIDATMSGEHENA